MTSVSRWGGRQSRPGSLRPPKATGAGTALVVGMWKYQTSRIADLVVEGGEGCLRGMPRRSERDGKLGCRGRQRWRWAGRGRWLLIAIQVLAGPRSPAVVEEDIGVSALDWDRSEISRWMGAGSGSAGQHTPGSHPPWMSLRKLAGAGQGLQAAPVPGIDDILQGILGCLPERPRRRLNFRRFLDFQLQGNHRSPLSRQGPSNGSAQ